MIKECKLIRGTRAELSEYFKRVHPAKSMEGISELGEYEMIGSPIAKQLDEAEAGNSFGAIFFMRCVTPASPASPDNIEIQIVDEYVKITLDPSEMIQTIAQDAKI